MARVKPAGALPWRDPVLLGWLLITTALASLPHWVFQPWWVIAVLGLAAGWRWFIEQGRMPKPGRLIRALLAVLLLALVWNQYRTLFGRDAGLALLMVLFGLKLIETRSPRDYAVSVFLLYLVMAGGFLYEQAPWVAALELLAVAASLVTLIRLTQPTTITARQSLRLAGSLLVQALPLLLVLYLFFPRFAGALWTLPVGGQAGLTGMSETMQPGSLGEVMESSEPAFRVSFRGAVPPAEQRYFRMLVLWQTDGRRWDRGYLPAGRAQPVPSGPEYRYELILEPNRLAWLPVLDRPVTSPLDAQAFPGEVFERREPTRERLRYELSAWPQARDRVLATHVREAALQLPPSLSPRVRELAERLRAERGDSLAVAQAAFEHFRREPFVYTLRPPRLGPDPVDEFLFETRRGYCEHYASAFVTLMRAARVPARVVMGYQGGELNPAGNYLLVRQSDAHAWAEIWDETRGWVRVDPTAAVAPARIERGSEAVRRIEASGLNPGALTDAALTRAIEFGLFERLWRRSQLMADYANLAWYRWVADYGADRQSKLFEHFGWPRLSTAQLIGMLTAGIAVVLLAGLWWLSRRRARVDPARKLYDRFCRQLARAGLARASYEGPMDFARRCVRRRPTLAPAVGDITRLYLALRYGPAGHPVQMQEFRRLVKDFSA
ncbi:MAG: hypothetical protein A2V91_04090 [Candidatus Muproteobacteria bacterium RBG_16_64_10]|uniref:Transglutaminase-like domain-containing protein n=1 Tax=Candidatus Muproteobacteria bacterium RBG_16_64_10 TaxID=1817757 RepID=A0A1F6SWS4_9PROT|nr:MAG: hypothetical protein A2V91_04090 [Candidatus Muproteobacteria bacterium RBG_16_64_10]